FFESTATYTTDHVGAVHLNKGESVDVVDGFTGTGDIGTRYTCSIFDGCDVTNLKTADFSDSAVWAADDSGAAPFKNAVNEFLEYLDGNMGILDNPPSNTWSQSTA